MVPQEERNTTTKLFPFARLKKPLKIDVRVLLDDNTTEIVSMKELMREQQDAVEKHFPDPQKPMIKQSSKSSKCSHIFLAHIKI